MADSSGQLVVLYVEDEEPIAELLFPRVKEIFGDGCRTMQSAEEAEKALDDDGVDVDLVIMDRKILYFRSHEVATDMAGDDLFETLLEREIAVAVVSNDPYIQESEPYASARSSPCFLGCFPKNMQDSGDEVLKTIHTRFRNRNEAS